MRRLIKKPNFPKLAGKMGENGHDVHFLAKALGISPDTVRRSLYSNRQFELKEIFELMTLYESTFEELFIQTTQEDRPA